MTDRDFVECHVEEICLPSKYGNESLVAGGLVCAATHSDIKA